MLKVLVIDDELDIREGLAHIIDWTTYGFAIVAEAANGKEALAYLEKETIHLIVTDISMPVMNGLEFIKELRARGWQHNVIVLSAYNDFGYLKEALKYRVENYLLKPVDEDELVATLLQVKEDIHYEIAYNLQEKENLNILRSKVLNRLVTRNISHMEFMNKADFLQIDLAAASYRVILIELESATELFERSGERFDHLKLFSAMNICQELLDARMDGVLFEDSHQHLIFIAKFTTNSLMFSYEAIADEMKDALKRYAKQPASVIIGPEVHNVSDIHLSYYKALELLEYKFYLGREATINDQQVPTCNNDNQVALENRFRALEACIMADDAEGCLAITSELYDTFKLNAKIGKPFIQHATFELFMTALKQVKEANGDVTQILSRPEQLYSNIQAQQTIDDMREYLDNNIHSIMQYLILLKKGRPVKVIKSVIEYIQTNFNQEITLKQAAETVFINPGYLGKLFKKETGLSFHDYLNKVRIDKAKELLLTTNQFVYQVSERVGYKDYNYFHKTFKKYVGTTPSDFQ
ncbi:response regulator [Cohnella mopanensis]|uniref:response regulator n=1 Tax=Cohnella mopanensis TaxID=2911966 RepID=UPI001EF94C37|nr:response regulator [Cohnella mopanensis]